MNEVPRCLDVRCGHAEYLHGIANGCRVTGCPCEMYVRKVEPERPVVDGVERDEAIGYALLETEHIGGFARRAPYLVEKLEQMGWTVSRVG